MQKHVNKFIGCLTFKYLQFLILLEILHTFLGIVSMKPRILENSKITYHGKYILEILGVKFFKSSPSLAISRRGKQSSNPRLQSLLTSVNRHNVPFFHNSAKAGQHNIPDYFNRRKDSTCHSKDCAIERFLEDIQLKIEAMSCNLIDRNTTLLSLSLDQFIPPPEVLAATSSEIAY